MKAEWLDGVYWEATEVDDFPGRKVETFRTYLYRYAEENGTEVQTEIVDESTIRFRFALPGEVQRAGSRSRH